MIEESDQGAARTIENAKRARGGNGLPHRRQTVMTDTNSPRPLSGMTTGEAEAWRAGYESAKAALVAGLTARAAWHREMQETPIEAGGRAFPRMTQTHDAYAAYLDTIIPIVASMEPPA